MNKFLLLALSCGILLTACEKDDNGEHLTPSTGTSKTKYIITATPAGTTGVADYLLTVDDIAAGSISTKGNGIEQDGSWRYYITHKNRFFSMLYGQGNPGAVTTYALTAEGRLFTTSNFVSETVQTFASVGDDILLIKSPRSGTTVDARFFRVNADQSKLVGETSVNVVNLAGNGERAHFTWATQVDNKVFAPYMSIKGISGGDVFGTSYPDSSWVAVFSYPELKLEKVIKDNRTSYIGAYFTDGLSVDENGDIYAFSPAAATSNDVATSTNPSAFLKIKKGTTEFDQSYFFNVQQKSGGHHISSQTYVGNGKFILHMYGNAGPTTENNTRKIAVADVYAQTFAWVTGLPDEFTSSTTRYNLTSDDKKTGYVGINTPDGNYIYSIDVTTAKATRGIKVEGGTITAIQKLKY